MSFDLGELVAKLKLDATNFDTKLTSSLDSGRLHTAGRQAGEGMMDGVQTGLSTRGAAVASFLGNLASQLAMKLGDLAIEGAKMGLSIAAQMETANISFTTMLGSGEKAGAFIKQLSDFAAKTPFEFPGLQTAASSLISIGIDSSKVIPIMTTLGNVTSGMGTGAEGIKRATVALQQMNAAGKIQAQDLNQLRDAGIPVYDLLAAAMGKSKAEIAELANQGKLGKDALDAMMGALETGKGLERFNGLMEKQSASLAGMWSTFHDNLGMGLAKAIEPLLPMLKSGLGAAADYLGNTVFPNVTAGLTWLIDAVKLFQGTLSGEGANVDIPGMNAIIDFASTLGAILEPAQNAISLFWNALTNNGVSSSPAMNEMAVTTNSLATAVLALGNYFTTTWTQIQTAATAMAPVVLPVLSTIADLIWNQIIPAFANLYTTMAGWYTQIQAIIVSFVQGMMERIQPMVPTIQAIFTTVAQIITDVIDIIKTIIGPAVQWMSDMWAQHGDRIMNVVAAAFGGILAIIQGVLGFIGGFIHSVMLAIHGDWSGAWESIKSATMSLVNGIVGYVKGAFEAMNAAIGDKIEELVMWFLGIPGRITSALGNVGNLLKAAGQAIIDGFLNGLKSSWNKVTDFVGGIADWISANKGPLNYDYTLLQPHGRAIMGGLGDAMRGEIPNLKKDLDAVTATIAGTDGYMTSKLNSAGVGGTYVGKSLPEEITLVDSDGTFLGKLKVVAREAVADDWTSAVTDGRKVGASL